MEKDREGGRRTKRGGEGEIGMAGQRDSGTTDFAAAAVPKPSYTCQLGLEKTYCEKLSTCW